MIGTSICKGKIKSNFVAAEQEDLISPIKSSVVEGCRGKFSVAVISKSEPELRRKIPLLKKKANNDNDVYLTYGKSCAVTDRPFMDYGFFRLNGSNFLFGRTGCPLGGCGDTPTVAFDLDKCRLVLNDCSLCT